jgi:hypothetical protein
MPFNDSKVKYIEEEVGYWRKANAIHKWFVDNVQDGKDDCGTYPVEESKLKELLEVCKKVKNLAITQEGEIHTGTTYTTDSEGKSQIIEHTKKGQVISNINKIAELLPTQSGFFFGGTEYDEYYLDDIDHTIEILEDVLADNEANKKFWYDYYYHSSW